MSAIKSRELEKLIGNLAADITQAHVYWQLRCDLFASFLVHPLVRQQSPTFWDLTLGAVEAAAISCLCRAFDQHDKALHLRGWLNTIKANLPLFSDAEFRERMAGNPFVDSLAAATKRPDLDVLESDIKDCSPSDPVVNRLIQYRGNALAHRNAKFALSDKPLADHLDLSVDDVETLLARADEILNRYSMLFSAVHYVPGTAGHGGHAFVFKSAEAEVLRHKAELRREAENFLGAAAASEIYGDEGDRQP